MPIEGGIHVKDSLRRAVILRESGAVEDVHIVAHEGSETSLTFIVMPGVDATVNVVADLVGEGANVRIAGLYVSGENERVTIRTSVRHRVPSCSSDQIFTGIAGGHSKVGFQGIITVAPGAQKTEAYQQSRSLLLSPDAKVETMPQL